MIYNLMTATYTSKRNDIQSRKESKELLDEWPYLFQAARMKAHFKELTGIDMNDKFEEATTSKFRRISYIESTFSFGAQRVQAEQVESLPRLELEGIMFVGQ